MLGYFGDLAKGGDDGLIAVSAGVAARSWGVLAKDRANFLLEGTPRELPTLSTRLLGSGSDRSRNLDTRDHSEIIGHGAGHTGLETP